MRLAQCLPTMTQLSITGNGKLWFAGAYQIDDLVGNHVQHETFIVSYRTACPFEGVIDGAFDRCATIALSNVLAEIIPNGMADTFDVARARNELSAAIRECDFLWPEL